jgi:hypothetical protein
MSASPAIFVAVVASGGAIYEIADASVDVGCRDELMRRRGVAIDASKRGIVRGNLVAIVADRRVVRDGEVGVLKRGIQPACGGVAGVAGRRKSCGDVIRYQAAEGLRAAPSGLMATVAGGIRGGQRIVVVDMAIGAGFYGRARRGRHLMRASERPSCSAMIEFAVGPSDGVMARGAKRSRKGGGDMIGHNASDRYSAGPIGPVAAVAIGICTGEAVIIVDVA